MGVQTILKGMTWDHPRGYDPLIACSRVWAQRCGVQIQWDKRSLQDFESYPVQTLAQQYDLIVIDHPHVGQVAAQCCLRPLDEGLSEHVFDALQAGSVGPSLASYRWQGRLWALPVDATAIVQAWMPDRLPQPASDWDTLTDLARQGGLICPMRAPHALMALYTLAAHLGVVAHETQADLYDVAALIPVLERLQTLAAYLPDECWNMDPIAVFERMSSADSPYVCAPYLCGYARYAQPGFRARRIAFADIPVLQGGEPCGSTLAGTGMAVSAFGRHGAQAAAFAHWVASAEVQRTLYAQAGGQPGHAAAWDDDGVNALAGNFYHNTRRTLNLAWVRPRHAGTMAFQQQASDALSLALRTGRSARAIAADLNALYGAHLPRAA